MVKNCTFTGNKAGKEGNDTYLDSSSSTSASIPAQATPPSGPEGPGRGPANGPARGRPGGRAGGENLPTRFQPSADFSVIILGSGGPPYDPKRSGPSVVIQHRGRFILVDMGNGTQARLYEAGISAALIDAMLITHHHRDHDEEFMPLLDTALVRGRPLEIVGTPGTKKMVDFTAEFYAEDIAYRIERTGRSAQNIRKPIVREIRGGESFTLGTLAVRTAQVPHSVHTVTYRFDVDGQSIVISGDLTHSDKLVDLARSADVLVMDSGGAIVRPGQRRPANNPARQEMAHPGGQDVASMAQKAGVKKLVLTHVVAEEVDEQATITSLGETYKGQVIVGRDLLQVAPGK